MHTEMFLGFPMRDKVPSISLNLVEFVGFTTFQTFHKEPSHQCYITDALYIVWSREKKLPWPLCSSTVPAACCPCVLVTGNFAVHS